MRKYSNVSPRSRQSPMSKLTPVQEETNCLVFDLQNKLMNLEVKYSKFVDKCSSLLKSNELKAETKEFFSSFSSSIRLSPDFTQGIKYLGNENNDQLLDALKDIEEGNLLKYLMKRVSEIVMLSQDGIFKLLVGREKIQNKVKDMLNQMLGEIWQVLFDNENSLQGVFRICLQKIGEIDKFQDRKNGFNYKNLNKIAALKESLHKSEQSCKFLEQKLKEQNKCLKKIFQDQKELKNRIFTHSVLENRRQSQNSFRNTPEYLLLNSSRSITESPNPDSTEKLAKLRQKNQKLKLIIKNLSKQNSALQSLNQKYLLPNETKPDSYEIEKKEIQGQLKSLQEKLMGFEKIAKNLIDSSIKTEFSLVSKGEKSKKKSGKYMIVDSPEISLINSHCSLLDADQMIKNFEIIEKEKVQLELVIENSKREYMMQINTLTIWEFGFY
ncbi:hypothetical protein SteCoe_33631 [Stentor coeruleus]|uniref:Uncharacterized protein n=1 Tax=Stentor coeruleus TaxID=5963 RepID=A0A1R2AWN7_9CILI|nr:hypothetical protein SteCoe_33631 [Stentor coeruleus]